MHCLLVYLATVQHTTLSMPFNSQVKLSFIVIPLHVGTYSGMKRCASQDHDAT